MEDPGTVAITKIQFHVAELICGRFVPVGPMGHVGRLQPREFPTTPR